METKEHSQIAWHPAFVEALQMELEAYKDVLEFHAEFQLTSEPLRIDCVIIKKVKDVVIKKNIAVIFREWNLLEYKSPDDYVSIEDFYKVYGYACLYASFKRIPVTSLTVTFVESHYPAGLIDHLRKTRGYTVEKTGPGIYNVTGDILPIQLIDSRQLTEDENLWLKNLSNRLDYLKIRRISSEAYRHGKVAQLLAYLQVIARANTEAVKEAIKMTDKLTIEQVFEEVGWTAKWEARGEARGEAKGREIERRHVLELINQGLSADEIKQRL
ncbi:MAG: hypothetical protein LBU85_02605 [Treponema sp.]|jgi:hypothetical protein|nr:hypothetical protein [Treponema sp.]